MESDFIIMSTELSSNVDESYLSGTSMFEPEMSYDVVLSTCDNNKIVCRLISLNITNGVLVVSVSNNTVPQVLLNKLTSVDISLGDTQIYHTHFPLRTITVNTLTPQTDMSSRTSLTIHIQ